MRETSGSQTVSTKLQRIAQLAKSAPTMALTTLAHHIDIEWLKEAHRRTRKDGATGVDQQTAEEYAKKLDENLRSLLERAKAGTYRAPPVRRAHIPKGSGSETRPIGIPTFEDKVLQRAVAMVLEAVYETEFYDFSYGFRPGRSAHQALAAFREHMMKMGGGWVVEVDIRKFFDTIDHARINEILRRRVRDGVILRLIGKWLNAGVFEQGAIVYPESGTPQGGVVSPVLANVFLHDVLDRWFVTEVKPRLRGRAELVRYADDFVVACEREEDARRLLAVLHKRFEEFGLQLHPEKTRIVDFRRPSPADRDDDPKGGVAGSFDLLGFTHHWGLTRGKWWAVKFRTAKDRLSRALHRIGEWMKSHRHAPLKEQHSAISSKCNGHYAYYGVTFNSEALKRFAWEVKRRWKYWLSRRSWRDRVSWTTMQEIEKRLPLPKPRIVHSLIRSKP